MASDGDRNGLVDDILAIPKDVVTSSDLKPADDMLAMPKEVVTSSDLKPVDDMLAMPKEVVTSSDLKPVDDADHPPMELPDNAVEREDRHRELRAMLLSVHPCPPLPQIALGGLYKEERVFSSHDFLATAIDRMLVKKDKIFDAERRNKQHALVVSFFENLRKLCAPDLVDDTVPVCDGSAKDSITLAEVVDIVGDSACSDGSAKDSSTLAEVVDIVDDSACNNLVKDVINDSEALDTVNDFAIRLHPFDKLAHVAAKSSARAHSEQIFDCFTTFSRQHAIVYFLEDDAHHIDIRFKDLDHVCKGDPIHLAACSHLRAYRIVRGIEPSTPTQYHNDSYADVLVAFAHEVVRLDEKEQ
jgi:hypothetical protein